MDIIEICKQYSRIKAKIGKSIRTTKPIGGVTRTKLGNLLEYFKMDILGSISSQLDTLNIKWKLEDEALTTSCPRCRKRHDAKYFPLNNAKVCAICAENHETKNCPSLPRLQAIISK